MTTPTLPDTQITNTNTVTEINAAFTAYTGTAATVVATGMDTTKLDAIATAANNAKIASEGISGVMALTSGQDSTELTRLFSKDQADANDTVVATGMGSAALNVVATNAALIATSGITGTLALTSGQSDTQLTTLFGKYGVTGGTDVGATVVATGMVSAALDVLATNTTKIKDASITGIMALTSDQNSTELTALFSKDDAVANDTVVATGMDSLALNVVAANAAKITAAKITGVMALTSGQNSTALTNLFSKDDAIANATVNAASMDSAALNVLATNIAKIAASSITGAMALTSGQAAIQLTALFSKDDAGVNDTVTADGMVSAQLDTLAITANAAKIASISGVMALTSGQDATELTTLFGKETTGGDDTVVATGMLSPALNALAANTDEIAAGGITGTLALTSGQSAVQLGALLGATTATAAVVNVNAAGMGVDAINALVTGDAKVDAITGAMALTSSQNSTALTTLFAKDDAVANDTVVATGMATAALDVVALNAAKIVAAGISGVMALTSGQEATELTALFAKDDATTNDTVVATGMNSAALNVVAANVAKINAASITGVMALTSGQAATQLTALFGKDDAVANDTVVATGMVSAQLDTLAITANAAKIASISGVMALTSGQDSTELTTLFGKESSGADDTVVATGMLSPALDALAANVDEIAADGITGTVAVTSGQDATELDALLGKTSTAATVTVNAASMGTDALDKLVTNTTKVDTITGAMALTSGQDSTELSNLFGKDDAVANDTVVATGMATAALDVIALNAAKIVAAGISGVMALTSGQEATELTALFAKDDAVADATVNAASMNSAALNVVAANVAKIAAASITGAMALASTQSATQLTALFGKDDAVENDTVVATGMVSAQLDAVAANAADHVSDLGITGVMALTSGQDSTELTNLFAKDDGTADATVVATGMSSAAIDVISLNTDKISGTITGVMTLTSLQDATDLGALFAADDTVANATVDATDMASGAIDVLATNVDKIALASIKGAMTLTSNQSTTALTSLFGKDDAVANDIVNAAGMDAAQLAIVTTNIAKVTSITGVMDLSGQSSTALTTLFAKDDVTANDTVNVTGMNTAALDVVAANAAKIANASITGTMALASGQDSTELTALFGKYGATAATVVATGMNTDALNAVATNVDKITAASITGVMALTSGQNSTALTALFGKDDTGATDTVIATGMDTAALDVIAANVDKITAAKITGVMTLTSGQDSTELTALFGKDDSVADATVAAAGVSSAALDVLVTNIAKVASITGAIALTSGQNSTALTTLFSKDDAATDDTVDATSMDTTALDVVAANAAKVASISGVMALTSGQDSSELTTLFGKEATVADDTVVATGLNSAALDVVAANIAKIDAAAGITGIMALTSGQDSTELTALFGKDDATTNDTVVATGMLSPALNVVAANVAKIASGSITGVMALTSGQDSTALTNLFSVDDTVADATVVATGMNSAALTAVAAGATKVASISGVMALTSDQDSTALTALFGKEATVADDTVVATSMDSVALDAVAANVAKIAAGSITGVMALTSGQNATELTNLFSKDDAVTNATVVADGVSSEALNVLATNIGKINTITGVMALTSGQTSIQLTTLFTKDDATTNDTVVADGMGSAALDVLALNTAKIADSGITGAMALTSGQDATEIGALFSKYSGSTATVRTTGMDINALNALGTSANLAKISAAGITGTIAISSGLNTTVLTELFSKDDVATNDTVVATGMSTAEIDVVALNTAHIAAAGITGVMTLTSTQDATDLTALFSKDDAVMNAAVTATGMVSDVLDAVVANADKVASITGVIAFTSGQNSTELTTLFGKETGTDDTVVATGMNAAALDVIALNQGKIAAAGITGVMALTSVQDSTELTALFGKDDATADATVNATGMDSAALNVLVTNIAKIDTASITGAMHLTSGQDSTKLTTLFGKDDTGANDTVVATDMNSAALDVIAANQSKIATSGITGVMALTSGQDSTELTALFGKDAESGTLANDTVVATNMNSAALDAVALNADKIGAGGISGAMALTSGQDAAAMTALFDKYTGTTTTVNPVGVASDALSVIADNITKVSSISAGTMALSGQSSTQLTALFSKDNAAADDTVNATGMSSDALNVLALNKSKIAAASITGVMALGSGQTNAQLTGLFSKDDGTADATVNATGMSATALDVIALNIGKVAHITGVMDLTKTQDSAELGALIGAHDDTTANISVNATGMDAAAVLELGTDVNIAKIDSITGALALDNGLDSTQLGALFGKYDGTSATVNVTSMDPTELGVVFNHLDQIGSITGTLSLTNAYTATQLNTILTNSATGVTAVATGMNSDKLDALAANTDKIATDGITGTMVVTSGQSSDELTALFGKYATGATGVEADATGMDSAALDVLAATIHTTATAGIIAPDKITGDMSLSVDQNATELTDLFTKYATSASDVVVNVSEMGSAAIDVLAANAGRIAASGITGVMALTSGQNSTALTALFDKYDGTTATVAITATEFVEAELNALVTAGDKIADGGITGVMALTSTEDSTDLIALFAKYEDTGAAVVATGMAPAAIDVLGTAVNIEKISGITGVIAFSGQDAAALTNLFGKDDATADDTVFATGMDSEAVSLLATNIGKIASISGDLVLDSGQDATALGALFTAYTAGTGTTATVVATGMDSAALDVLATNNAMIQTDGITGVMALTSGQIDTELTALFDKEATVADDTVVATGMDSAAIDVLVTNIGKIKDVDGITGVLALGVSQAADTVLTDLFSKYDGTEATVAIDNTFTSAALNVLATHIGEIDTITGVIAFSGQDASQLTALFGKDDAGDDTVDATNMGSAELAVLVTNITKLTSTDGITGALALTAAQNSTALTALFNAKDAATTATVDVTGMDSSQIDVIVTNAAKIASASVTGTIALTPTQATALKALFEADDVALGNVDAGAAGGLSPSELVALADDIVEATTSRDGVASITGVMALTSGVDSTSLGILFSKYDATGGADVTVNAAGMLEASLQLVAQYADTIADGSITGVMALTSGLGSDELTALFGKDDAANTSTVVATGMSSDAVAVVAANAGHLDTDGITGTFSVASLGNDTDLGLLLGKVSTLHSGTDATVTIDSTHMSVAELDAVATDIAKVDSLVMNRTHSISVAAADITGSTLDVTGGVITVTGTAGANTIDLSSVTGHRAGSRIVGGLDDDAITLDDTVADVVELASTGTDTVTGFNVTLATGAKDKIAFADAPSLPGVGSVSLTNMTHEIVKGVTKVNNNVTTAVDHQFTTAEISAVLNVSLKALTVPSSATAEVYYLAIDDGVDTAIARIDAGANDTAISVGEITVIGILNGVGNAGSVSFTGV